MLATYGTVNFLVVTLSKKKKKKVNETYLIFYLIQHIQSIINSTYNQCNKFLSLYSPFSYVFVILHVIYSFSTFLLAIF